MDIHRARFVPYPTPAINALAFSHQNSKESKSQASSIRLAVGRANGDIEIWNPDGQTWVQERIFHGGQKRSIEGLAWIQDPSIEVGEKEFAGPLRLFSIGFSNAITEWNLESGLPARSISGSQSEIWCLAAQPKSKSHRVSQELVAGCADGSILQFSTEDGDLVFKRFLTRPTGKSVRTLSLAFQTREIVVAGFSNGTLGIFDVVKGINLRSVSLGAAPKIGPKDILVWSVKCLPNGDIVTGDSLGEVRIFDGKLYSQIQRLASHDADILDLAICKDTKTIFSTGMDRKTSTYSSKTSSRWAKQGHITYHEHDVKAMATYEGKRLNVIASGGLDTNLVILPMKSHKSELRYTISGLPQYPPIHNCTKRSLFACWWDREINIWKITSRTANHKRHHLMAKVVLKGEENIFHAALNHSASHLAVVTASEFKLFKLSSEKLGTRHLLQVDKVISTDEVSGRIVAFSPDDKWLAIVTHSNSVKIIEVESLLATESIDSIATLRRPKHQLDESASLRGYKKSITRMSFSPDSKMLVVTDLSGYIDSWVLTDGSLVEQAEEDEEESGSESDSESEAETSNWKQNPAGKLLPRLTSPCIVLSFRPKSDHNLFILTSLHQLVEFDMHKGNITDWSRRNTSRQLPGDFNALRDRATGSFWGSDGWLWLYSSAWLFGVNVDVDHDSEEAFQTRKPITGLPDRLKKRKKGTSGAGDQVSEIYQEGLIPDGFELTENGVGDEEMDIDENEDDVFEVEDEDEDMSEEVGSKRKRSDEAKSWFLTLKYRPILGIVPIRQVENNPVEVVLVERPIWDLELPPRFEKIHA